MKFSKEEIERAYRQLIAEAVLEDEETGSRFFAAYEKAMQNIESNRTIKFTGKILGFTSMGSFKQRFVTADGCHKSCECKGLISYHSALYAILSRAYQNAERDIKNSPYLKPTPPRASNAAKVGKIWVR